MWIGCGQRECVPVTSTSVFFILFLSGEGAAQVAHEPHNIRGHAFLLARLPDACDGIAHEERIIPSRAFALMHSILELANGQYAAALRSLCCVFREQRAARDWQCQGQGTSVQPRPLHSVTGVDAKGRLAEADWIWEEIGRY